MNYRHIYHAGNFADVFKHSLLVSLIDRLQIKDKPLTLIDTHAGIGLYDLKANEVTRNPEYQQGILPLLAMPDTNKHLQHYLTLIRHWQQDSGLTHYPGSPWIMRACLREQDELILNELHPEDYETLRQTLSKEPHVHYHHRDAYEFLPAILPPRNRRGIILIDPPFEKTDEFAQLATLMSKAEARFANGCYLIWYPIKATLTQKWLRTIMNATSMPCYQLELRVKTASANDNGLIGCGVLLFNPPWGIEEPWESITEQLQTTFTAKG